MQNSYRIPSGENEIAITVFQPKSHTGKLPIIILGAGWKNSLENNYEFAGEVANGVPAVVVVFDYSGIGTSSGQLTHLSRKQHLDDLIAVYDWAIKLEEADISKVGVNGGSYSGYMAALLIAQRPVASLLLRVPGIYPDATFDIPDDTDLPRPDDYFEAVAKNNTAPMLSAALTNYKGPLLVQEREGDSVITKPVIEYFLVHNHSAVQKHTVLKGAGHKISGKLKEVSTRECIDWFKQTL